MTGRSADGLLKSPRWHLATRYTLVAALMLVLAPAVRATEIQGVQTFSADQPQTSMMLLNPDGTPVQVDDGLGDGGTIYDIQTYLDTGTSTAALISLETTQSLNIGASGATFNDVSLGGTSAYNISTPYAVTIGPFNANYNLSLGGNQPDQSQFVAATGQVRLELNPNPAPLDPIFMEPDPIDITGMAALQNKVVVIDLSQANYPNPISDPFGIGTAPVYVYPAGTPYRPSTISTDPGIVPTDRQIKVSFANFARFTSVSPADAAGPAFAANPMIGPDPVAALIPGHPVDNTPPVTITYGGHTSTGSFLFDTGAQASFISTAEARNVGVYQTTVSGEPYLYTNPSNPTGSPVPGQFVETLTGADGNPEDVAGFNLDTLSLPTVQGDPITFDSAPVLVTDITVTDPTDGVSLTLDGDLGMNFFYPSASDQGDIVQGAFNWLTFDQANGLIGVSFDPNVVEVPEPAAAGLFIFPALFLLARRRANSPVRA